MWEDQQHAQSSCSVEMYYDSRNNPHPKMVRHIRGINNALICFVRTSFSRADPSAGDTGIPKQEAHQERVLTGNAASNTSANRCLPKLEGSVRRELRTPESLTQGRVHVPEMTQNTPSFEKVLGKLSKILQTDSLTKIQKWFATASEKEKEDIFRLIYSEPTDKGMLNSKEGTAETVRSPSLQKPFSPLRRSPEGIRSQSRSSARESVASQNTKTQRRNSVFCSQHRNRGLVLAAPRLPGKNRN
ncbi:hypothetical protein AV530_011846 [Patagioenas fasciata monilis]|uniref:Uncharacterized protein n=2 Tax=Patagioenas fasciata monilis TaxID=372326 RepID=A0A1V4JTV9_PATFA|nr:hypothetical protein AV530_011846 [Patagioenas fasciata monilis]